MFLMEVRWGLIQRWVLVILRFDAASADYDFGSGIAGWIDRIGGSIGFAGL
jgi:hypothetical protein